MQALDYRKLLLVLKVGNEMRLTFFDSTFDNRLAIGVAELQCVLKSEAPFYL